MLCLCADIRSYKVYLVYAVTPISWQRSRLIVWKVCKTENLEWFVALYSSITFKGRTDRDSLKGGYEKFIEKLRKYTTQYQYCSCRKESPALLVKTIPVYSEMGMQIKLTSLENTIFINNYDTIVVTYTENSCSEMLARWPLSDLMWLMKSLIGYSLGWDISVGKLWVEVLGSISGDCPSISLFRFTQLVLVYWQTIAARNTIK